MPRLLLGETALGPDGLLCADLDRNGLSSLLDLVLQLGSVVAETVH